MSEFVEINKIVIDENIYPRESPNLTKIQEYKELINDGRKFPPIIVNKRTMHLIDGYHRLKATKLLGILDIAVEFIDIPEELEWIEAISRNSQHGLPLKRSEIKELFKKQFKSLDGKISSDVLAVKLGVSRATIYRWISELEEKENIEVERETHKLSDEDKKKIIEMYESGNYTREEIAEKFGITPKRVYQIVTQGEEVSNENSSSNLSDKLTKDDEDVNIETYPGPPIPKPINDSDDDDFDDFNDLDDEDIELDDDFNVGGENKPVVFTRDHTKIGKIFDQKIKEFLDVMGDDTAIELYTKYIHEQIPQYGMVVAERLRITIPRIHMLIGKILERR